MKKLLFVIVTLLLNTLNGMFVQSARFGARARAGAAIRRPIQPTMPTIQKRTLYQPEKLKGLYSKLTKEAQPLSPAFGAVKYESGVLPKMYALESDAPAIKLVKAIFYQRDAGGPIKPTTLKSNPAYSLTPSIIGLIMGALETNKIQDPTTRKLIIDEWRAEHKNVTGGDKISQEKVNNLLNLIVAEYTNDKANARALLLSFLYAKANPDNNHDMLHYLTSLSKYITIFMPGKSLEEPPLSFMGKITNMANTFKNFIYKPQTLEDIVDPEQRMHLALHEPERFEEAISIILKKKQTTALYPPVVIQSDYGFQDKKARPNCVEAAFQDIFNIILYDSATQLFDLSLLPPDINPIEDFRKFYSIQGDISNVNSPVVGQAFMDMVSNIPNAVYSMDNYELQGEAVDRNFIVLMNYFFNLNATDLQDISKALSDQRRTISFTEDFGNPRKINMQIIHHHTNTILTVDFCFRPGHGWLEVPQRISESNNFLLDPVQLSRRYNLSETAQALFSLEPTYHALSPYSGVFFVGDLPDVPPSFYYTVPSSHSDTKYELIMHILRKNAENTESSDYAYTLFQQLSEDQKISLFPLAMQSGVAETNKKFKTLYKSLQPENEENKKKAFNLILKYNHDDPEAVDYAYTLFEQMTPGNRYDSLEIILTTDIWKTDTRFSDYVTHNVNAKNSPDPNNSITPLIMACLAYKTNYVKLLLERGADPNIAGVIKGKTVTPLLATVRHVRDGRNDIIIELIKYNVDVNTIDSYGNTALDIVLEQKILLQSNTNSSYETVSILQNAGGVTNKKHSTPRSSQHLE